jgi:hypothetical protein
LSDFFGFREVRFLALPKQICPITKTVAACFYACSPVEKKLSQRGRGEEENLGETKYNARVVNSGRGR